MAYLFISTHRITTYDICVGIHLWLTVSLHYEAPHFYAHVDLC